MIKTRPHPGVTTASSWSRPVWGWGTARNTGWRWQTAAGWSPHSDEENTERQGGKVAWAGKCSANIQEFTLRKEMGALTVTILSYTNIPDTIISSVRGFNFCSLLSHSVSTFIRAPISQIFMAISHLLTGDQMNIRLISDTLCSLGDYYDGE